MFTLINDLVKFVLVAATLVLVYASFFAWSPVVVSAARYLAK